MRGKEVKIKQENTIRVTTVLRHWHCMACMKPIVCGPIGYQLGASWLQTLKGIVGYSIKERII